MSDSAFEQQASNLHKRAESASLAMGMSKEEAEDIAQEVMLRLWAMHETLEDTGQLEHLPTMMARRLTLNMIRSRRTVRLTETTTLDMTTLSPAEALEEREDEEWLEKRLAQLPTTQNIILRMRQVERREIKEIATLLGIKATSVSTLLARARRSLLSDIRKRNER